jgi:hypothetical protein
MNQERSLILLLAAYTSLSGTAGPSEDEIYLFIVPLLMLLLLWGWHRLTPILKKKVIPWIISKVMYSNRDQQNFNNPAL